MKVALAGATIDRRFWKEDRAATPETISAAYARVSHSPRELSVLRDEAVNEVDKARASNERIIYRMGHSSVAEHAVFNLDVSDCSRLLVEFIEHHRLASYTERSQRYVFFGNKTFVLPDELKGTPLEEEVRKLEGDKFDLYNKVAADPALKERFGDGLLEQARYVLGLTCPTDIGLTVNAREAEHMISQGAAHPLSEVREFSKQLLEVTCHLAPSLIKYTKKSDHAERAKREIASVMSSSGTAFSGPERETSVRAAPEGPGICSGRPTTCDDPETEIAATLIFENSSLPFCRAREIAGGMRDEELMDLFLPVFRNYPVHASLPRAFEMMDLTLSFHISASAFAQLKRHRMATIITQPYDPGLWETPEVFLSSKDLTERFWDLMKRSRELYGAITRAKDRNVAEYVLTNAHKRRVIFKANLREMYHFVRLRSDVHAQEEIRVISDMIVQEMKKRFPVVTAMLCGKDGYPGARERIMGCYADDGIGPDPLKEGKR
ncbi:MAG: FAD-dependent thymidylate synthase [Candidatus Thermoplasmatota archaeon]|nr:FAD-dependent thymidylate synthase [Candidatus Thermoplasmatota archaeon]